jgi:hypothetical protein
MANNQVFADIEQTREVWTLAGETESGVAVMQGTRAGVTMIGTPGITRSHVIGPYTITGIPVPNNGQADLRATVHTTGTFEFAVEGGDANTLGGVAVYFVALDGSLSLTATDNVAYGIINAPEGYVVRGTVLPVKIGVVA